MLPIETEFIEWLKNNGGYEYKEVDVYVVENGEYETVKKMAEVYNSSPEMYMKYINEMSYDSNFKCCETCKYWVRDGEYPFCISCYDCTYSRLTIPNNSEISHWKKR